MWKTSRVVTISEPSHPKEQGTSGEKHITLITGRLVNFVAVKFLVGMRRGDKMYSRNLHHGGRSNLTCMYRGPTES